MENVHALHEDHASDVCDDPDRRGTDPVLAGAADDLMCRFHDVLMRIV